MQMDIPYRSSILSIIKLLLLYNQIVKFRTPWQTNLISPYISALGISAVLRRRLLAARNVNCIHPKLHRYQELSCGWMEIPVETWREYWWIWSAIRSQYCQKQIFPSRKHLVCKTLQTSNCEASQDYFWGSFIRIMTIKDINLFIFCLLL